LCITNLTQPRGVGLAVSWMHIPTIGSATIEAKSGTQYLPIP
jgi:hypothetical protein